MRKLTNIYENYTNFISLNRLDETMCDTMMVSKDELIIDMLNDTLPAIRKQAVEYEEKYLNDLKQVKYASKKSSPDTLYVTQRSRIGFTLTDDNGNTNNVSYKELYRAYNVFAD